MYRLLIVCIALQVVVADKSWCDRHPGVCKHQHHDHKDAHAHDGDFHSVSWQLVNIYRRAQRMCDREVNTSETYGSDGYQLSVSLPDFTEDEITVKARHRVLFVQAFKAGGEGKAASELLILPDFVKVGEGYWIFSEGRLNVNLPYTITFGSEKAKTCDITIDDSVVTIPKRIAAIPENVV